LPLSNEQTIIGILFLNLFAPHRFSSNDKQILELFTAQAAVAIQNARSIQAWREAQKQAAAADKLASLGQVGAEFAHRMNNLAGTIPARVDLAQEKLDPHDPHDRSVLDQLEKIKRDTKELLQAAQTIRSAAESRIFETVDVNQTLQSALDHVWASPSQN